MTRVQHINKIKINDLKYKNKENNLFHLFFFFFFSAIFLFIFFILRFLSLLLDLFSLSLGGFEDATSNFTFGFA